jgi:glycine cleavage system H protein
LADYDLPDSIRYSRDDEWIRAESDGSHRIGVTDYAQQQLGDVVFVELPDVGTRFEAGQPFGVIESVKAVSDLYAPVAVEILEVNAALEDAPETVNADCYGAGWLVAVRVESPDQVDALLDAAAYKAHIDARAD